MRKVLGLAFTALAMLAIFAFDALTPQDLTAAILFDIPIVFAALSRSRRFTAVVVLAALACDAVAACLNASSAGWHWDTLGIGNRLLSALSIVIVGVLGTVVQERARRLGAGNVREARMRREVALAGAVDRLRAALSRELVERAVVREAVTVFDIAGAAWIGLDKSRPVITATATDRERIAERVVDDPAIASLVQSVLDDDVSRTLTRGDAYGRLLLERFDWPAATVLPVRERDERFGVLVLGHERRFEEDDLAFARAFARAAGTTLVRARLFAELADRNDLVAERNGVIRDLVFALTHDLRTPLRALAMTMRQARDGAYGTLPAEYAEVLDSSLGAVGDLQRLAETLLTVARFETAEREPVRELVDVAELARSVAVELAALADARRIMLGCEAAADAGGVLGDRADLRRAVSNLVSNALDHTPQEGTVLVRITMEGRYLRLAVVDDGYGIPEARRAQLFRRFMPVDAGGGGRAGLGLYLVRRIAEETGGTVAYAPRRPRGSEFAMLLPCVVG